MTLLYQKISDMASVPESDIETGVHVWRMAAYAQALAGKAGWSAKRIEWLELAAAMHDTGEIGISEAILNAPRKLTEEEWRTMQSHTQIGAEILGKTQTPVFLMAAEIAHYHHEKWDGSGYPDNLAEEAIPESARIVAIADAFEALTTKRPYKEAWSIEASVAEIKRCSGSHFEPRLVELFEQSLPEILRIKAYWDARETLHLVI